MNKEKIAVLVDTCCDVPVSYTHLDVYKRQASDIVDRRDWDNIVFCVLIRLSYSIYPS